MKIYAHHGISDFIVCLGYKGYMIKEYFANFFLHASDVTFDVAANKATFHASSAEPWRITLVDTGEAAIRWTADWHRRVRLGESPRAVTYSQIEAYSQKDDRLG